MVAAAEGSSLHLQEKPPLVLRQYAQQRMLGAAILQHQLQHPLLLRLLDDAEEIDRHVLLQSRLSRAVSTPSTLMARLAMRICTDAGAAVLFSTRKS